MDAAAAQDSAPGSFGLSFLLDTDTCSAHMKNVRCVNNRFYLHAGRLHISTVTLGELYVWALRSTASPKRMQSLLDLLNEVQVLAVDAVVARKFGDVRAWQFDHGLGSPELDLLNGAVALVHDLTMVTHNQSDYDNIPNLRRNDWLVP
jgi:tRNA(fMet)-specific endonuclease VapC